MVKAGSREKMREGYQRVERREVTVVKGRDWKKKGTRG